MVNQLRRIGIWQTGAWRNVVFPIFGFKKNETNSNISRFEKDVLRIFDPYVDIRDHQIEEVEGRTNTKGCPIGKCNVKLKNGDSIFGSFKFGIRQGRGATSGNALIYKKKHTILKNFFP